MPEEAADEATQLVLLAALLEPVTFTQKELSGAIRDARGDLAAAAEALLLPRVKSSGKRKAGTSLESWLGKKREAQTVDLTTESDHDDPPQRLDGPGRSQIKREPKAQPAIDQADRKDAFAIMKSATSTATEIKQRTTPQSALLLTSQAAINKQGLPLTLLTSPLSPSFASALYLAMMEESEKWDRHRWYLAGRWVESPHTSANYKQVGGGHGWEGVEGYVTGMEVAAEGSTEGMPRYFYSGAELNAPAPYPDLLRQAAEMIEPVVNASLRAGARYPLEWAGDWRANVCGANRYDGASSGVGWHADQLSYLGPYATIASLSLGTPRAFRLRETDTVDPAFKTQPSSRQNSKSIRTYEVNLGHNSLVLMNGGCQERYKHTVPPQKALDLFRPGWNIEQEVLPATELKTYTARINITFRFYRPDFHPSPGTGPSGTRQGTPYCRCGIPTLLRADQKAKARSRTGLGPSPKKASRIPSSQSADLYASPAMINDDMAFFWQCQSVGTTGELKGCGFFRVLDMRAEGRGPCVADGLNS